MMDGQVDDGVTVDGVTYVAERRPAGLVGWVLARVGLRCWSPVRIEVRQYGPDGTLVAVWPIR